MIMFQNCKATANPVVPYLSTRHQGCKALLILSQLQQPPNTFFSTKPNASASILCQCVLPALPEQSRHQGAQPDERKYCLLGIQIKLSICLIYLLIRVLAQRLIPM